MLTCSPMAKRSGLRPGPALKIRPTGSSLPCTAALTSRGVPRVMRCTRESASFPIWAAISSSTSEMESGRLSWRVATLAWASTLPARTHTASVWVPPQSMLNTVSLLVMACPAGTKGSCRLLMACFGKIGFSRPCSHTGDGAPKSYIFAPLLATKALRERASVFPSPHLTPKQGSRHLSE